MDDLRRPVLEALATVIDPELGLDVVALGLVYDVTVDGDVVNVALTMTTAACPLGEQIAHEAEGVVARVPGVREAKVELVWDPPWTPDRMSPGARAALGWGS